jgi:hypothetical protein
MVLLRYIMLLLRSLWLCFVATADTGCILCILNISFFKSILNTSSLWWCTCATTVEGLPVTYQAHALPVSKLLIVCLVRMLSVLLGVYQASTLAVTTYQWRVSGGVPGSTNKVGVVGMPPIGYYLLVSYFISRVKSYGCQSIDTPYACRSTRY